MHRFACLFLILLSIGNFAAVLAQEKNAQTPKKLADGVYAVLREGPKEKDLLPLKDGEGLVVDLHPYLKKEDREAPRYLVVHSKPDVELDLAGEPKAVKEGDDVVRILLKLQPTAAAALERLTTNNVGKQVTIILAGDVVTAHKIRDVIKGGEVQISCCAPGSAKYLLERLQEKHAKK